MSKYQSKCGPEAVDNYDDYEKISTESGVYYERSHIIAGSGVVNDSYTATVAKRRDSYNISQGITELGDGCFNKRAVVSVSLPTTLTKIGSNCFRDSKISSIQLPDNLESIGENNFPPTLSSINIPPLLSNFPVSNIMCCDKITEIVVDDRNTHYKTIDGVLYNHEVTEVLFCPNGKMGKVIIPNTVKRIGDYCFYNCKKLTSIYIPTSVTEIGTGSFYGVEIDDLTVRNSVVSIGEECFRDANVKGKFIFSQNVTSIPARAFINFKSKTSLNFLNHLVETGEQSFYMGKDSLPNAMSLYRMGIIGNKAFGWIGKTMYCELFSTLDSIGAKAFHGECQKLTVRYFSYAPIKVDDNAFDGMCSDSTLVVPKGTRKIFENASPWNTFPTIEECDIQIDENEEGKATVVRDEVYYKRLKSIAESKQKANRDYLREVIYDLALNYQFVNTDDEYNEVIELLRYNRSFMPAIIPDLEKRICQEWNNKYKLMLIGESVSQSFPAMFSLPQKESADLSVSPDTISLPIASVTPETDSKSGLERNVKVFFNEDIFPTLKKYLVQAKSSVRIAVSWFTNYSLFKLVKDMSESGISIQLVTNNDLINNGGYCLNLNELIEKGVEVSLVEYPHLLHHKFCVIDGSIVINGSYNWTRFSDKNYENVIVMEGDKEVADRFNEEFENILDKAEYKCIDSMPETVKERPEYDRSSFRQYITEELDAEARESTENRDKITALQKAIKLNPSYLDKINPSVKREFAEVFDVIDDVAPIQKSIESMMGNGSSAKTDNDSKTNAYDSTRTEITSSAKQASNNTVVPPSINKTLTQNVETPIEKIKASGLVMILDVSGSMKETYAQGHVYNITKKALSASMAMTESKEVSLWTFSNYASFVGSIGIGNINDVENVKCQNTGTNLSECVKKANGSINRDSLVVIFTDDDQKSIQNALSGMTTRPDVFWQIIVYGKDYPNISKAINGAENVSVVCMYDYASKSTEEISHTLLNDYIRWKQQRSK